MALPNIFDARVSQQLESRINRLTSDSSPQWGKMNASQMLAHLNVMFEIGFNTNYKRPNACVRFILQKLVKKGLVNESPYKKNSQTAPEMLIKHDADFKKEHKLVLQNLRELSIQGESSFENKVHPSFGKFSAAEWSNLFYKHIDHHLKQFNL